MLFLYNQNPNLGEKDGTKVSTGEDFENAIVFKLNSVGDGEEKTVQCAVRCDEGYKVEGNCTISLEGDGADKWALSANGSNWNEFGAALELADVTDVNTLVHIKCKADSNELPSTNKEVKIVVEGTVTVK